MAQVSTHLQEMLEIQGARLLDLRGTGVLRGSGSSRGWREKLGHQQLDGLKVESKSSCSFVSVRCKDDADF